MAEKGFGVKEINLIGASGTPTIESPNNLNLNAVNVAISTNVSIGGTLTVSGNVSVGGTLTYEDVTNVDSVGLITARSGIHINNDAISGIGITINESGINVSSGIITAPSFRAPYNGGFSMTQGQYNNGYYINSTGGSTLIGMAYYSNNTIGLSGNGSSPIPFVIDDVSTISLNPDTGGCNLNYAGSGKLSTTNTGINVTGAITVNGAALSIDPTATDVQVAYELINTSSSGNGWRINGNGIVNTTGNPDLYLIRGQKYRFINNSGGSHPFRIQSDSSTSYDTGVTNNNSNSGNIDFVPRNDAPARLYYNCTNHGGMLGNIYLRGAGGQTTNVGVTTFSGFVNVNGNFGLETSSPVAQTTSGSVALTPVLDLKGTGSLANASGVLQFTRKDNSTQGSCIYSAGEDAGLSFRNTDGNGFGFYNGTTLSVRIKPNGKVFFGSGDTQRQIGGGDDIDYVFEQLTSDSYTIGIHANQNNQRGIGIHYPTGKTPEAAFIYFVGTSPKTVIRPDGDLENANNNYSGLSDSTLKENIVDANSQWDDIKNIKIRNFNFKASTGYDTHKQIGVVAQELETVCPNLVDVSTEHGMKTVSSSVLYMKGLKALQEAMIKIENLEAEIAALKS